MAVNDDAVDDAVDEELDERDDDAELTDGICVKELNWFRLELLSLVDDVVASDDGDMAVCLCASMASTDFPGPMKL